MTSTGGRLENNISEVIKALHRWQEYTLRSVSFYSFAKIIGGGTTGVDIKSERKWSDGNEKKGGSVRMVHVASNLSVFGTDQREAIEIWGKTVNWDDGNTFAE